MNQEEQGCRDDHLTVGIAQIAPVWLDREKTLEKIIHYTTLAGEDGCQLVAFGEALLPGYPFWIELTDGARFNSPVQKEIHAHYVDQAVLIEAGHLDRLCRAAAENRVAVYIGCIERAADRGGHSLYCSLVYIDAGGNIRSIHRKLMPTYEERLTWSPGDGHGLRVHPLPPFTVGGLNCWENWMPLARAALYAQGEDLHVAVWPGGVHNTADITRFIARESRSYVLSAAGLMRKDDFPAETPHLEAILANKLKSVLTALGIIFGVGAVISMLAVGTGAQQGFDVGHIMGTRDEVQFRVQLPGRWHGAGESGRVVDRQYHGASLVYACAFENRGCRSVAMNNNLAGLTRVADHLAVHFNVNVGQSHFTQRPCNVSTG